MSHSFYPLANPFTWLLWAAHAALFLLLPGHMWIGRYLRGVDWTVRCCVSVAGGLALAALFALGAAYVGPWLRPWHYLVIVTAASIPLNFIPSYRESIASLVPPEWQLRGSARWLVLLACLVISLPTLFGQLIYSAPAGQAAGHTLLAIKVGEARTIDAAQVLESLAEAPGLTHGLGWHAVASLTAQVGRMDEFLTTWLLPLGLVLSLPVMFWLAWRALGFGARAASWAALLLPATAAMPEEVLAWGGLGYLVGWYLIPFVLLAFRAAWMTGRIGPAIMAALSISALLMVNALELVATLVMILAAGGLVWRREARAGRLTAGVIAGVFLVCALLVVQRCGLSPAVVFKADAGSAAGGGWIFHGGFVRPYHVVLFGCIPLVGWLAATAWRRVSSSRALAIVFAASCLLWLVVMDFAALNRIAEHSEDEVFAVEDQSFAHTVGTMIGNESVIANLPGGGSGWVMILSGRRFLNPGIWPGQAERGAELNQAVMGLKDPTWAPATLDLQRLGVRYLYVNDRAESVTAGAASTALPGDTEGRPFSRHTFDLDPRFWPIIEGGSVTVYEILWHELDYMLANLM